jgi:hypothetical protein
VAGADDQDIDGVHGSFNGRVEGAIPGDLTNVSYLTLALIGDGGASPHGLVDMHRRGARIYYAVAASRLYAEPKRLEQSRSSRQSARRPGSDTRRSRTAGAPCFSSTSWGLGLLDAHRQWLDEVERELRQPEAARARRGS